MAEPSGQEVLMIALINRARLDPAGEAARYGIALNEGLAAGTLTSVSRQVLAFDTSLFNAADAHSQAMIDRDFFAHTDPIAGSTQNRVTNAGYTGLAGENIGYVSGSLSTNQTSVVYRLHEMFFVDDTVDGRGHRLNILNDRYQSVGVGQAYGDFTLFGTTSKASLLTVDFGFTTTPKQFVTGLSYLDTDGDAFYSVGEGRGNMSVQLGASGSTATGTAGAYTLAASSGVQQLTFSGGGLSGSRTVEISVASGRNALVNLVDAATVETSVSLTAIAGVTKIIGLGNIGLALAGSSANDTVIGSLGDDTINGGAGNDLLRGRAGADTLTGSFGNDLFYFAAGDLAGGAIDTVMDGGVSTNDLIRIDGAQYYQLGVTSIADGARIAFDGGSGFIDVKGVGTNPIVVATSTTVAADFTQLSTASKADLQISYFDFANSQPWTKYTELNNGSGQLARQFGSYDGSGGSWDFLYDVANTEATYATRFDYFNASGQKTSEVGTYDSPVSGNTKYILTYDPAGAQIYTTSTTYYDALDRPTSVQAFYDAGGSGVTTFDPNNTQAYDYYTTFYDAMGRATQSNGVYDGTNGSYYVKYDPDNVETWQSLTMIYDHAGAVTQQWLTMDNGTIVYI